MPLCPECGNVIGQGSPCPKCVNKKQPKQLEPKK